MKKYFISTLIAGLLLSNCGILNPPEYAYHTVVIRKDGKIYFQIVDNWNRPMRVGTASRIRAYEKETGKQVWFTGVLYTYATRKLYKIPYGYQDPEYCKETRTVNPQNRCIALPLKKGKTYIVQPDAAGPPAMPIEKRCVPVEFTP